MSVSTTTTVVGVPAWLLRELVRAADLAADVLPTSMDVTVDGWRVPRDREARDARSAAISGELLLRGVS